MSCLKPDVNRTLADSASGRAVGSGSTGAIARVKKTRATGSSMGQMRATGVTLCCCELLHFPTTSYTALEDRQTPFQEGVGVAFSAGQAARSVFLLRYGVATQHW